MRPTIGALPATALRLLSLATACVLLPALAAAQGVTGMLIGTVRDPAGLPVAGARVTICSPALIGGPVTQPTQARGQFRFPSLPPGTYALHVDLKGFVPSHVDNIEIGSGATIDWPIVLVLEGFSDSVVVDGSGSRIDARDPGFGTRFGPEDLKAIPTRRNSMFDPIKMAPGISPTSPSSGINNTVSAFGSATNENQFLIDDTNMTCPCNGVARAEVGVDFIHEIQVQSIGASVEFGNLQGAVINVITRQGGERFLSDASYYAQGAGLTSRPVRFVIPNSGGRESAYERARYRDATATLGGPAVRQRLWFFTGYQYLRDYDSQPGTDPAFPRTYEQNKIFAKLTWKLAPAWQLVQSIHDEHWVNPEQPTISKPIEATLRAHAHVPAITFGQLTHTVSSNTLWDLRVGRFVYAQKSPPSSWDGVTPSRQDASGFISGAPAQFTDLTIIRTTGKATLSHYRPGLLGADHQFKTGVQIERGEHHAAAVIPTGAKYVFRAGQRPQQISSDPSNTGGLFSTASGFASDAFTIGDRLTVTAGVRFDHIDAVSQDLHAVDPDGHETDAIVAGLGRLYTWNLWSPRVGVTAKLTRDGFTILRGSYGQFHQGVLTGELAPFHPGATSTTSAGLDLSTGLYTVNPVTTDPRSNLELDRDPRAPRTDEYAIGVDREIGRRLAVATAYIHKNGRDYIGWTDIGGDYHSETRLLADGTTLPVSVVASTAARLFFLTNPSGYSMTYNGVVTAIEKRRDQGWQAFGSYTYSRVSGLLYSSGATAAGAQVSTTGPPAPTVGAFGQDPNTLTNARGRLPNDRPHILRVMGAVDIPKTGLTMAANLGYFSGKPWAAAALVSTTQDQNLRILLEPRGSRRLPSQTLLDVRLSRPIQVGWGRIEVLLDVLNVLNETAAEGLVSDVLVTESVARNPSFGQPSTFVDPRRAMLGVRLNLGR